MTNDIVIDAFNRIQEEATSVLEGLTEKDLTFRPSDDANSIAWLIWHLTRVQDDHIADLRGEEQVYTAGEWAKKFDLPFDDSETGYGFSASQVGDVQASAELLSDYLDAVHQATVDYITTLDEDDYEKIIDESYDPPVTLGVRLVSVLSDDLQHVGQAAYVRGLLGK